MADRERMRREIARDMGLPVEQCTDDARFHEDLGGDSLDLLECVFLIEREFDVSIPDERLGECETVGGLLNVAAGASRSGQDG